MANESNTVRQAYRAVEDATRAQQAAWARWNASQSEWDKATWDRAYDAQRAAEARRDDVADRWESWEADREDRQSDWWDAAWSNARVAA